MPLFRKKSDLSGEKETMRIIPFTRRRRCLRMGHSFRKKVNTHDLIGNEPYEREPNKSFFPFRDCCDFQNLSR